MNNIIGYERMFLKKSTRVLIQASILSTAKTAGESAVSYQPRCFTVRGD
ncbi:MAG: hypothetical protein V4450_13265 [Bacteroidota bacterium]